MRLRVALAAVVGAAFISGCSGGGGPERAAGTTTTTTPAERIASTKTTDPRDFCGRVSALTRSTGQVGLVTQLSQVKAGLAFLSQQADNAVLAGTPAGSGTFPALLALDRDMHVVNAWIQGTATQDDLDHNRQPPDVQTHFNDLGVQFRTLQAWTGPHCKAFAGGDGG